MPSRLNPNRSQLRRSLDQQERARGERRVEGPWQGYVPQHQGGIVPPNSFRNVMGMVPLSGELWPDWGWFKFEDVSADITPPHTFSLNLGLGGGGSTESLRSTANADLGFGDAWTISFWYRPNTSGPGVNFDEILTIANGADALDRIFIRNAKQTDLGDDIRLDIWDSAGFLTKQWEILSVFSFGSWHLFTLTWNGSLGIGSDLTIYVNGRVHSPTLMNKTVDLDNSLANTNRRICVGDQIPSVGDTFPANYHSLAIWNTKLDASNVAAIYANGNGRSFDLITNSSGYTSSANLVHWYLLGRESAAVSDYGDDFQGSIDLDTTSGVDVADREEKSPRTGTLGSIGFTRRTPCVGTGSDGDERIHSNADHAIGITDIWTMMVWVKPSGVSKVADERIFQVRANATDNNNLFIYESDAVGNVGYRYYSSAGAILKDWVYQPAGGAINSSNWYMLAMTLDASGGVDDFDIYINGVNVSASGDTDLTGHGNPDNSGVMTATNRRISLGGKPQDVADRWSGIWHQGAIWNVKLTDAEITALYNSGNPTALNLNANFGGYVSSAALQWWFKPEQNASAIMTNYATTPPATPTFTFNKNSASKLVQDNPLENDA